MNYELLCIHNIHRRFTQNDKIHFDMYVSSSKICHINDMPVDIHFRFISDTKIVFVRLNAGGFFDLP